MASEASERPVLDKEGMARTIARLAEEILEEVGDPKSLALVGIQRRGVQLAQRLQGELERRLGVEVPVGILDITLYRDDLTTIAKQPLVKETDLPFDVEDRVIVLVDDVLYTGRTVRAALDELHDFGRPARIFLAVLVDRGHRELPIRPDFVGKVVPTSLDEEVQVQVEELDGSDRVEVVGLERVREGR